MKIEKAIELLNDILVDGTEPGYPMMDNAIKLGIEALKDYQKLKLTTFLPIGYKLPGETLD